MIAQSQDILPCTDISDFEHIGAWSGSNYHSCETEFLNFCLVKVIVPKKNPIWFRDKHEDQIFLYAIFEKYVKFHWL